jgi:hypothetical protein
VSEEADPETDVNQPSEDLSPDAGFGEILLYSIDDEVFHLPRTQVPYYEAGTVVFQTEAFFQQAEQEGDQAWRSDPLQAAFVLCRNLLGNQQDALCADETVSDTELTTKAGLVIRLTPPVDGGPDQVYTAEMTAPGLGQYHITMACMAGTSALYIRKIGFVPGISEDSPYKDILIYSLSDDIFYNRPRTEVPEYARGELQFNTEEFFQSHAEGHQPWRSDPLSVVEYLCWNLLGDCKELLHDSYRPVVDRIETKAGLVVQLEYVYRAQEEGRMPVAEMTVPDLGKYMFELGNRGGDFVASYVKTITFTPD